jgi:hypothetical protein
MKTIRISPKPNCHYCRGTGNAPNWVDYGSYSVAEPMVCECVLEQIPENELEDLDFYLEIDEPGIECPPGDFD